MWLLSQRCHRRWCRSRTWDRYIFCAFHRLWCGWTIARVIVRWIRESILRQRSCSGLGIGVTALTLTWRMACWLLPPATATGRCCILARGTLDSAFANLGFWTGARTVSTRVLELMWLRAYYREHSHHGQGLILSLPIWSSKGRFIVFPPKHKTLLLIPCCR